jgi:ABC-2 type transport system ATP-binding protein
MTARIAAPGAFSVVAEGLTRRFEDFVAVDHVSFEVPHGDIFGFLGPNGAGKTTTIRMLLGIIRPTEGRASVLGFDIASQRQAVQERIGYMSQRFSLYGDLTVRENLDFYGRVYGVAGARLAAQRDLALGRTGLVGREGDLARNLAGGYRQRLALACAILHEPQVLFLDEPTAGVDPISRRGFWDFLYGLAEEGRTIFVTTHYMDEAENCRRLAFIDGGRIVRQGSPGELKDAMGGTVIEIDCDQTDVALTALRGEVKSGRLALDEVALYGAQIHAVSGDAEAAKAAMTAVLGAAGVGVRSMDVIAPSLEDVFIASVRGSRPRPA